MCAHHNPAFRPKRVPGPPRMPGPECPAPNARHRPAHGGLVREPGVADPDDGHARLRRRRRPPQHRLRAAGSGLPVAGLQDMLRAGRSGTIRSKSPDGIPITIGRRGQGWLRFLRRLRPPGSLVGCDGRKRGEIGFVVKGLPAGGFVCKSSGSIVDPPDSNAVFLGSLVEGPGSLVARCCRGCNMAGRMLQDMQRRRRWMLHLLQHGRNRCCIFRNIGGCMSHRMQQPGGRLRDGLGDCRGPGD